MLQLNHLQILRFALVLAILPFVALHIFNVPSADDFWYARYFFERGLLGNQEYFYKTWSGRYTSTLLLTLSPIGLKISQWYPFFSMLNMFFLLWGFARFVYLLTELYLIVPTEEIGKQRQWAQFLTYSLLLLLVVHFPSPKEGYYWYAGYINYTLPMTLLLWAGVAWLDRLRFLRLKQNATAYVDTALAPSLAEVRVEAHTEGERQFSPNPYFVRGILLTILVMGANEVIMLQMLASLGALTLFSYFKLGRSWRSFFTSLSVVSAACFAVVYLAPGNAIRAAYFKPPTPAIALLKSVGGTFEHIIQFLSLPLIVLILILLHLAKAGKSPFSANRLPGGFKAWAFITYTLLNVGFLPSFISMGGAPMARVDNMFYIQYLVFGIITLLKFFDEHSLGFEEHQAGVAEPTLKSDYHHGGFVPRKISKVDKRLIPNLDVVPQSLVLAMCVGGLLWFKVPTAYYDMLVAAPQYYQLYHKRLQVIGQTASKTVIVPLIAPLPKSLIYSDLLPGANFDYAKYYKKHDLRVLDGLDVKAKELQGSGFFAQVFPPSPQFVKPDRRQVAEFKAKVRSTQPTQLGSKPQQKSKTRRLPKGRTKT